MPETEVREEIGLKVMDELKLYQKGMNKIKISMKKVTGRYLPRIECHITDHCNLNCQGCSHFSNISSEKYKDVKEFERELACISTKIILGQLKLLGGEPLLHPELLSFLKIARKYFPKSEITVCTNCLLLDKMSDDFWRTMKDNGIMLVLSVYPPLRDKKEYYQNLAVQKGIPIAGVHVADDFWAAMNRKGDSDPRTAYAQCQSSYCKNLRNGRLYICPDACYRDIYNNYFKQNLTVDSGIDIYHNSGRKIVKYLTTPKEACKYCTKISVHPWVRSKKEVDEWDAGRGCVSENL